MAEPFTVVAIVHPLPGKAHDVVDTYREVTPLIHGERGCLLYAVHLSQDDQTVVIVERWATHADLQAHNEGPAIARLKELNEGLRAAPTDILLLDAVPIGDAALGALS